jgi:hypothetical protein
VDPHPAAGAEGMPYYSMEKSINKELKWFTRTPQHPVAIE